MGWKLAVQLPVAFIFAGASEWSAVAQDESPAVGVEILYTADLAANVAGGRERGVRFLDNIDLSMYVSSDPLLGWSGATAYVYGIGNQGGSISELVGDAQGVDHIEAPTSWRVYEAWIEQVLPGDRVSILAGLYDLNSEFDVLWTASMFLNGSHGIGAEYAQSGRNGPSIFPATSLGVRARGSLGDRLILKAIVLDGVPGDPDTPTGTHVRFDSGDGLLIAGEAVLLLGGDRLWMTDLSQFRLASRTDVEFFDARFAIGAWKYTGQFQELQSSTDPVLPAANSRANAGLYALAEWTLFKEPDDATQGLSVFGRWGIANPSINRFGSYVGLGAVYAGVLPGRDSDLFGVALASARNGDRYIESQADPSATPRSETSIEASYYASIFSWLSLQADVQYVINPGTDSALSNALVPSLRLQLGR